MESEQEKHCVACEVGARALEASKVKELMTEVPQWVLSDDSKKISRSFKFKGFYKTMFFVNAIAYYAQQEGHHPDMELGYNYLNVTYTTHAIGGLSENDFICARQVDHLVWDKS